MPKKCDFDKKMGNLETNLEKISSLKFYLVTTHQNVNLHYQDKLKQNWKQFLEKKIKISG